MAQVQSNIPPMRPTTPPRRLLNAPVLSPSRMPDPLLPQNFSYKSGHLNLDTFSPVDQNGSFCFDRVIKSGKVFRRVKKKGAWKPSWKPAYLVLRPNLLSIYQDADETDLRASITLSDVTAVAPVRKSHMNNVFGVFSPAKNHHFQSLSERETSDWITLIRMEARTDEADDLDLAPPRLTQTPTKAHEYETTDGSADDSTEAPGSPEMPQWSVRGKSRSKGRNSHSSRHNSNLQDYSGNEILTTSHSDFSDIAVGSLPKTLSSSVPKTHPLTPIASNPDLRPTYKARSGSNFSIGQQQADQATGSNADPERVIRQGWLLVLKTKGGVKQWKSLWAVLRPKSLSFYKNEQEYSAVKILPMDSIINAAEIDPISRSKKFCLQVIIEDKTYRLCAVNEEELAKWLGALKSVLRKRHEAGKAKAAAAATAAATAGGVGGITEGAAALRMR